MIVSGITRKTLIASSRPESSSVSGSGEPTT